MKWTKSLGQEDQTFQEVEKKKIEEKIDDFVDYPIEEFEVFGTCPFP